MTQYDSHRQQVGATFVEVLIAALIMVTALVPALQALSTGLYGASITTEMHTEHYAALSMMEEVLAEPWSALTSVAATAGNATTATSYSDPGGTQSQRLVYIALYDTENADNDNDPYTVPDPNSDGDNNPFTGYDGALWIKVEVVGSLTAFETLTVR